MITLKANVDGSYQISEAANITSLAELLFNEFGMAGFSTTVEDLEISIINDFIFYASWAETQEQANEHTSIIDKSYIVSLHEWGIIEPVIRAHCELIQAQRVEATGSLGGDRFGLSVSEATQQYKDAKENMKKEAFIEAPFFIGFE